MGLCHGKHRAQGAIPRPSDQPVSRCVWASLLRAACRIRSPRERPEGARQGHDEMASEAPARSGEKTAGIFARSFLICHHSNAHPHREHQPSKRCQYTQSCGEWRFSEDERDDCQEQANTDQLWGKGGLGASIARTGSLASSHQGSPVSDDPSKHCVCMRPSTERVDTGREFGPDADDCDSQNRLTRFERAPLPVPS